MSGFTTIKTVKRGPATIVINRPVLTEKDRAKREQQTQETLERVMREYIARKENRQDVPA